MRVLIVDDSSTMRAIQKRCLEKMNVDEVVEAANGQEALSHFQESKFDIILSDWNMPVMNGLALLREIRSVDRTVPVIMVTTEAERPGVLQAINAGVSDYLIKPFTPAGLREKLERWYRPTAARPVTSEAAG